MKILIVDDHEVFLHGMILLLENNIDPLQILTAHSAQSALSIIEQTPCIDLLIMDIGLPDMDGCVLLQLLNERNFIIPTCVLSATDEIKKIQHVLNLGAMGFIPKEWEAEQIVAGLKQIMQGQIVIPADIQTKLNTLNLEQQKILLSKRQKEVLILLKDGFSNLKIAEILNISESTVKSHVSAIFQVFEVKGRMECVENAKKLGVI